MHLLSPLDVALRLRVSLRSAQRWCAAWAAAQRDLRRPRVHLVARPHRRGRPSYRVDARSLECWLRGLCPSNDTTPTHPHRTVVVRVSHAA